MGRFVLLLVLVLLFVAVSESKTKKNKHGAKKSSHSNEKSGNEAKTKKKHGAEKSSISNIGRSVTCSLRSLKKKVNGAKPISYHNLQLFFGSVKKASCNPGGEVTLRIKRSKKIRRFVCSPRGIWKSKKSGSSELQTTPFVLHLKKTRASKALQNCSKLGAQVMEIYYKVQNDGLKKILQNLKIKKILIGLVLKKGPFFWYSGKTVTYQNWKRFPKGKHRHALMKQEGTWLPVRDYKGPYICNLPPTAPITTAPSAFTEKQTTTAQPTTPAPATLPPNTGSCGLPKGQEARIVGGANVEAGQIPWQVGLSSSAFSKPFCGGSVIDKYTVVTAAHCVAINHPCYGASSYEAVVGYYADFYGVSNATAFSLLNTSATAEAILEKQCEKRTGIKVIGNVVDLNSSDKMVWDVTEVYIYEGYIGQPTPINDVAILKVSTALWADDDAESQVGPVCLPSPNFTMPHTNANFTVSGWGTLSFGGEKPTILQAVNVPVISTDECFSAYEIVYGDSNIFVGGFGYFIVNNTMVCAGELIQGGKDSCQGDSGGPLTYIFPGSSSATLVGVVSWGYSCAKVGYPGVYAAITKKILEDFIYIHTVPLEGVPLEGGSEIEPDLEQENSAEVQEPDLQIFAEV